MLTTHQENTTARLEARISPDLHNLLRRAARIQGRTVSDFVAEAVYTAAQRVVSEAEVLQLSHADQHAFAKALLDPPVVTEALRKAQKKHAALVVA